MAHGLMPRQRFLYNFYFTAVDNGPAIIRPTRQQASVLIAIDEVIRRGFSNKKTPLPPRSTKRGRPSKVEQQRRQKWVDNSPQEAWLKGGNRYVDSIRDGLAHDWNKRRGAIDTIAERWLDSAAYFLHGENLRDIATKLTIPNLEITGLMKAAVARYYSPVTTTKSARSSPQTPGDKQILTRTFNIVSFMRARRIQKQMQGLPPKRHRHSK